MQKICIIIPYFGNLPSNFQIWLNSCKYNNTINWILYTDDKTNFYYPSNVKVVYMSFLKLANHIQSLYDFKISLNNPYKLCDYKVAYGEIFSEYLVDFDFWGYCDVDLVFGNIRHFITEDILKKHDKILSRGHFTLFRNDKESNSIYKGIINGKEKYKEVFSMDINYSFDEWCKEGINYLFAKNNKSMYDEIIFSDIYIGKFAFYPYQLMKKEKKKNSIYEWNKGCLHRLFLNGDEIVKEEVMYIHLQKRKMLIQNITSNSENILIIPNKYVGYVNGIDISLKMIKKYGKNKIIYKNYIIYRLRNFKNKLLKGVN